MTSKEKVALYAVLAILAVILIVAAAYYLSPADRAAINAHMAAVQAADDATSYETLKLVEDTARAMISSWESDLFIYRQYKDSDDEEKRSWAEQALIRANRTASTYNNYILKNSHVWAGNVPSDIASSLPAVTQ